MSTIARIYNTEASISIAGVSGLANGGVAASTNIDFLSGASSGLIPSAIVVYYSFAGATAPSANYSVNFYWARGNTGKTIIAGSIPTSGGTTAPYGTWTYSLDQCQMVGIQPCEAVANQLYSGSFVIYDPGPNGSLLVYNNTGQALGTSPTPTFTYAVINNSVY